MQMAGDREQASDQSCPRLFLGCFQVKRRTKNLAVQTRCCEKEVSVDLIAAYRRRPQVHLH